MTPRLLFFALGEREGALLRSSGGSCYNLARTQHFLDLLNLAADEQDVRHVKFLSVSAGSLHDQVARAQAKNPVAEKIAALL